MRNDQIKYETSTDYAKLYRLLKEGNVIVGFIAIDVAGRLTKEHSKVVQMSFNNRFESFDLGFILYDSDFGQNGFEKICKEQNVRYIPLNTTL